MNRKIFLKQIMNRFFLSVFGLVFLGMIFQVPCAQARSEVRLITQPDHWLVCDKGMAVCNLGNTSDFVPAVIASTESSLTPPTPFSNTLSMQDMLPTDAIWITHPTNPQASELQFRGLMFLGGEFGVNQHITAILFTVAANDCVKDIKVITPGGNTVSILSAPLPSDTCNEDGPFFTISKNVNEPPTLIPVGYYQIVITIGNNVGKGALYGVVTLYTVE
jgi:hypothetical protein